MGAQLMTAPVDAGFSGEGTEAAFAIHDVDLTVVAALVPRRQELDGILGGSSRLQQSEPLRAVEGVDEGLRGDRTDARSDVGHDGADGEEPARYDNADL